MLDLYHGTQVTGEGNYVLAGGELQVTRDEYLGNLGVAVFRQSGGRHGVARLLLIGRLAGSQGSYVLDGGDLRVEGIEYVGHFGTGTFTQNGGVHIADYLYVGNTADSRGTYNLQDGNLTVGSTEYVGLAGTGTFTQSGGVHTARYLYVAKNWGSRGTYVLQDGNLTVGSDEYIGYLGTGTFTQMAGAHTIGGSLYLGYIQGSATYDLECGNLFAGDIVVGGPASTGTFIISGGGAAVDGKLTIRDGSDVHLGEGTLADSDPDHPYLDVDNSGTLYIEDGVYCLGRVQGIGNTLTGTVVVESGATLWVESIKQDSLIVKAGGTVHLAAENYELFMSIALENQGRVPEPGTLCLLGVGGLLVCRHRRRQYRMPERRSFH